MTTPTIMRNSANIISLHCGLACCGDGGAQCLWLIDSDLVVWTELEANLQELRCYHAAVSHLIVVAVADGLLLQTPRCSKQRFVATELLYVDRGERSGLTQRDH